MELVSGARGQSSATGSALLVAVVVVAAVTAGLWAFATVDDLSGLGELSESTGTALSVAYEDGNVTVEHDGGNTLDPDAATVVLSSGGQTRRVPLSAFDGAGAELSAGEAATYTYTPRGDRVSVLVVHEPSGGPLLETALTVDVAIDSSLSVTATNGSAPLSVSLSASASGGVARPSAIEFAGRSVSGYGGSQDADANSSVIADGYGVGVYGDSWRAVDYDYDVTEDTVLHFQFRSDDEGEIHGIGLDTDRGSLSQDRVFKLHGTQSWGIRDFDDNYTTGDGWQTYEIPVGDYFTGEMEYLVLAMDGDADEGVSEFRNVRLYEENGTGLTYEWRGDSIGTREGPTLNHTFVSAGTYDVSVTVTDAAGNSVTERTTVTVGPGPDPVDFAASTITPWEPSQDNAGGATVTDDHTLTLRNNTWKQASLPTSCTVGSDTVLTFEFRSDDEGEIHGIGFDDSDTIDPNRIFKLHGTQDWGIDDYETYDAGDGWVAYEIPVGQYYTGTFSNLAFTLDDDAESDAHAAFRNVSVYDRTGDSYTRTCT
jgi:hypothetical protein